MKVAQVSTLNDGGAAIVAIRLHKALLELGVNSLLFTKLRRHHKIANHHFVKNDRFQSLLGNLLKPTLGRAIKLIRQQEVHPNLTNRPRGLEIFSPYYQDDTGDRFDLLDDKDVIHLHWINTFISEESFFQRFREKKFVWTLHDMNPITGGCHHSNGCRGFEFNCKSCPQLQGTIDIDYASKIQDSKMRGLGLLKSNQLIIVSPSQWLLDMSKRSSIMKKFEHVLIRNPSFEVPNLNDRFALRKKLGLPQNRKIVIFVSSDLNNPRKGTQLLFDAISSIPQKKDILLLGIGEKARKYNGLNVLYTGKIFDSSLLAKYLQASDLFATATLAESSSLVIIEALTCGVPVVATKVGGIPELINPQNGLLFPSGDALALASKIVRGLFEIEFDRQSIRNMMQEHYNPREVALNYRLIYQKLLER